MTYFILKCALSGIIIGVVSEVAKRSPAFGALIVSLPLVSLLAIIWLWRDTGAVERTAVLAQSTFWYALPSTADVPGAARLASRWRRILAEPHRMLRPDRGALLHHRADPHEVRHRPLSRTASPCFRNVPGMLS